MATSFLRKEVVLFMTQFLYVNLYTVYTIVRALYNLLYSRINHSSYYVSHIPSTKTALLLS
ncbi:hypothetical protein SAMN04488072_10733 [Lentibacillus halodurans]|uniref:Uncharacterized protein n=1 Tax=Lentibacillus halodurans TaxID=237679 RepID=A0A1I0YCY3_9BACI|nr:hypothetical protein SAMN04488072_10733 [Lentibacillus halodurans]